jgi:dTDP-4-dehydrorhamnose reductase
LFTPDRDELDVTSDKSMTAYFLQTQPDWIINCAAYVEVDKAEEERDRAFKVNAYGAFWVARVSLFTGARVLHVSTDYVFDGEKKSPYTEEDPTNPLGVYAESKLHGEQHVMATNASSIVARSAWLYGIGRENFPSKILRAAMQGKPLRIVSDRLGSPTYTVDLARAIGEIIDRDIEGGIYHVVNAGVASWYDIVREMLIAAEIEVPLEEANNSDYPTPAERPGYSALSGEKLAAQGVTLPPWQDAVRRYVAELRSAGIIPG